MDSASRRTQSLASHLSISGSITPEVTASPSQKAASYKIDSNGIAVIMLNNPPVNSITEELTYGVIQAVKECQGNPAVKGVVLIGANNKFSGGADISKFGKRSPAVLKEYIDNANVALLTIENGSKPVVAAIESFALGGGLEFAMGCHARVCTEKCSLGLPELTLGVIPGFGGTQRLPRLVGVQKAVDMMLTSRPINAKEAKQLGLVDDVVKPDNLLAKASELALQLSSNPQALRRSLQLNDKFADKNATVAFINEARKKANKNLPHQEACLQAVLGGVLNGGVEGLKVEAEQFTIVAKTTTTEALVHMFFASKQTSKVPGVTDIGLKPRKITKAAVLGGGTMGSGIVTALILSGVTCILKEINQKFLDAGINRVKDNLQRRIQSKRMTQEQYDKTLTLLRPQITYDGFKEIDIVIEAAIEDIELKQNIFVELEKSCGPDCILATNTSTIDLDIISRKTRSQNRIVGTHFFSPAHIMNLLEIVRTKSVSNQVLVDILEFSRVLGKTPIVVGNCIGFTVNRMFFPYGQAAMFLVERGIDPYRIDQALEEFGMPMGAFKMCDLSGLDVFHYVGNIMSNAYKDRAYRSSLLEGLVKANRLGQKTGAGFYKYEKRATIPDQTLGAFISKARQDAGNPPQIVLNNTEIAEFILYAVANEALRVLEENMVVRSSDIDIGAVYGYGFPAWRGGILKWIEMEGYRKVYVKLNYWSQKFNLPLIRPCGYLAKLSQ